MWALIERIKIRNFQSIKNLDIELGPLTVIVGPNSQGKSAIRRSIELLASNGGFERGTLYVSEGEKVAAVTAITDWGSVTIERGNNYGKYVLYKDGIEQKFTELNGKVPPEITKALRIQPLKDKQSINFHRQKELPYLLTRSGSEVAKTLGELTNVSTLFEAVREANRRRQNDNATLKTRRADVEALKEQAKAFRNLSEQLTLCETSETTLTEANSLSNDINKLSSLLSDLNEAELALQTAKPISDIPDIGELEVVYEQYSTFMTLISQLNIYNKQMLDANAKIEQYNQSQVELQAELQALLIIAKVCPTCEQEIRI